MLEGMSHDLGAAHTLCTLNLVGPTKCPNKMHWTPSSATDTANQWQPGGIALRHDFIGRLPGRSSRLDRGAASSRWSWWSADGHNEVVSDLRRLCSGHREQLLSSGEIADPPRHRRTRSSALPSPPRLQSGSYTIRPSFGNKSVYDRHGIINECQLDLQHAEDDRGQARIGPQRKRWHTGGAQRCRRQG